MRILVIAAAMLILAACAEKPRPSFMDAAFEKSTASKIVLLPLVDQRPEGDRADNPDAMEHFAGALADTAFLSSRTDFDRILDSHGYSIVKNGEPKTPASSGDISDQNLLYLELALTSYHSIPAINYLAGCAAEIRQGDALGKAMWINTSTGSAGITSGFGPLLYGLMRQEAFDACFRTLFASLPDRKN